MKRLMIYQSFKSALVEFLQIILSNYKTCNFICGQSYKASTIVICDSRVVPDLKIPHITSLDS